MTDLTALDAANAALLKDAKAAKTVKAYAAEATKALHAMQPPTPPPPAVTRWWPDTAWPNVPVPANPTVDPRSAEWIGLLVSKCPGGIYPNGQSADGAWSVPVYHAIAGTPWRAVEIRAQGGPTQSIPFLPTWKPAAGDGHFSVRDDPGGICEFQGFSIASDVSLHAHSFAQWNTRTSNVVPTPANHVSVLPTVAGLVLASEVAAGVIPHALRVATPCSAPTAEGVRWPAFYSDGQTAEGLPAGARLVLPRSVSLAGLDACQTMMAKACQGYGWYNGDSNGDNPACSTFFEAVIDGCSYPFPLTPLPVEWLAQMVVVA